MPDTAVVCAGVVTSVSAILLLQFLRAASRIPPGIQSMPLFRSMFRIPALLAAPAVLAFLSEGQVRRIERSLASVELESVLTPASWVGMRIMQALSTALLAALAALVVRAPILPIALVGLLGLAFCMLLALIVLVFNPSG